MSSVCSDKPCGCALGVISSWWCWCCCWYQAVPTLLRPKAQQFSDTLAQTHPTAIIQSIMLAHTVSFMGLFITHILLNPFTQMMCADDSYKYGTFKHTHTRTHTWHNRGHSPVKVVWVGGHKQLSHAVETTC